ncbi:hypothetical protein [Nocardia sp. NPDC049149]|uniref:hypothetical protein n=1 Tax=Nocardia sp. NPDC049149 TaxID=3364315 RepID=UPI0037190E2C
MTTKRAPIAAVAEADDKRVRDPFIYKIGTVAVSLPSLTWIKPGTVRKIRHLNQIDQMYTLFEMVLSPEELEAIDDLDPDQFEEMCNSWREHSGIAPGES